MNTQKVIDSIKDLPYVDLSEQCLGGAKMVNRHSVIDLIKKLDEPQEVTIPKFVAEWIESHKKSFSDTSAIDMYDNLTSDNRSGYYHEVWLWVIAHHHDFIKAWHDGYEVEREKLYTVEIPDKANHPFIQTYLAKNNQGDVVIFQAKRAGGWVKEETAQLTEAEIRKDFDWAWQAGFAEEVE